MKRILPFAFLALLALLPGAASAREAAPTAQDVVVEKRMVAISEELRCLVCQNESLSGSQADLAKDLRREIREQIQEGRSDQEILDFMVGRYGDFVRYRPPLKGTTLMLWFGPFALLLVGVVVLVTYLRRRNRRVAETRAALSPEEQQKIDALLGRNDAGQKP
ncbi:MAG: cytochrome c-type biogenesis protein CcmH [Betaproteobacteria bacterium]|jgi:cytochrome c-type biogenesis protein CcmH|nr:cytochrome c-type biogenesis protein CcmH [Betaproteobacteria bacterium]